MPETSCPQLKSLHNKKLDLYSEKPEGYKTVKLQTRPKTKSKSKELVELGLVGNITHMNGEFMKILLIAAIVLGSFSAFAHPGDDELMTMVDIGSTLRIQKDINIPASNQIIMQDGIVYRAGTQRMGASACRLSAYDKTGKDFNQDVVVKVGEVLSLDSRDFYPGGEVVQFTTSRKTILEIFCFTPKTENKSGIPTIGQFKKALGDNATLVLGNPIEL